MTRNGDWNRDHAASGWRSRAFLADGWQLLAYDDGYWEVRDEKNEIVAAGTEADGDDAKRRVVLVHAALVAGLTKAGS